MHIGLLTGSFLPMVGGLEWKVHHLACLYTRMGHRVTVLTALKPDATMPEVRVEQPYEVIRFGFVCRGMDRLGVNWMLGLRALARVHRRQPFEVIHAHNVISPAHCAIHFQKTRGIPAVLTPTGGDVQNVDQIGYGVRLDAHWDRVMRRNVRAAQAITAINQDMIELFLELGARNRPRYIPNGVNWEQFQGPRSDLLARRLGIEPGRFSFLAVGRNVPVKGYPDMLSGFAELARRTPRPVLVIVGRDVPDLQPRVDELGLSGRVHLLGQLPMAELPAVYHGADGFVSTSLMEGFPQVVAQALASGLPCILSDNPGHRAAGSVGGAMMVDAGDPATLADAMQRLAEDPGLARELSAAGHEGSRAYDWQVIAGEYLKLFEEVRNGKA